MANCSSLDKENIDTNETFSIRDELEAYFGPLKDGVKLILPLQDVSNKQSVSSSSEKADKITKENCGKAVSSNSIILAQDKSLSLFINEDEGVASSDDETLSGLDVNNRNTESGDKTLSGLDVNDSNTESFLSQKSSLLRSENDAMLENIVWPCSVANERSPAILAKETEQLDGFNPLNMSSHFRKQLFNLSQHFSVKRPNSLSGFNAVEDNPSSSSNVKLKSSPNKTSNGASSKGLKTPIKCLATNRSIPYKISVNSSQSLPIQNRNSETFRTSKMPVQLCNKTKIQQGEGKILNVPMGSGNQVITNTIHASIRKTKQIEVQKKCQGEQQVNSPTELTFVEFMDLRRKTANNCQHPPVLDKENNKIATTKEQSPDNISVLTPERLSAPVGVNLGESSNQPPKKLPTSKVNEVMTMLLGDDPTKIRELFPLQNPPKENLSLQVQKMTNQNKRKRSSIDDYRRMMEVFFEDDPALIEKLGLSQRSCAETPNGAMHASEGARGMSSSSLMMGKKVAMPTISKLTSQEIVAPKLLQSNLSLCHWNRSGGESVNESLLSKWSSTQCQNNVCLAKPEVSKASLQEKNSSFKRPPVLTWSSVVSQSYHSPLTTQESSRSRQNLVERVMMVEERPQFSQRSTGDDQKFFPTPAPSEYSFVKNFDVSSNTELSVVVGRHKGKRVGKRSMANLFIKKKRTAKSPVIYQKYENILSLLKEDTSYNNISKIGTENWLKWSFFDFSAPLQKPKLPMAMIFTTCTKLSSREAEVKISAKGQIKVYEVPNSIERVTDEETYESLRQKLTQSQTVYSFTEGEVALKTEKEQIQWRIKDLVVKTFLAFEEGQIPVFLVRRKIDSNYVFQNVFQMKDPKEAVMAKINYSNTNSRRKFCLILYVLGKTYSLLETDSKLTKREIFYQIKHLIRSQGQLDDVIHDISCLINVGPWKLNIVSHKGLVYGNLKLKFASDEVMNCNVPGTMIPYDVDRVTKIESVADFILVVEKESIFHKLIQEDLPNKMQQPFIMITGKGFPDLNTQLFLKKLSRFMAIPVLILADADPHGVKIMMTYRFGSLNNCHLSEDLAIPEARWLGVFPSEILSLGIHHTPISKNENKMLQKLLENPVVLSHPRIEQELRVLFERNRKAAIEGLMKTSKFLGSSYLPAKHLNADYI